MSDARQLVGKECRFAWHIPASKNNPDLHMVKEVRHYSDGTTEPAIRFIKNFKRDFYITTPNKRTYKQKKEFEKLSSVVKYSCTQSDLRDEVAHALERGFSRDHLKKLANSPYLYGTEISSTSLIKHEYMKRWPDHRTAYRVACLDIETDVVDMTEDPIIITITLGDKIWTGVSKRFIGGIAFAERQILDAAHKYIGQYEKLDNYELIIGTEYEDGAELIKGAFAWLHQEKPDIVAIWNINFDIPKMTACLRKYGVDPADVYCDPSIPKSVRLCEYKEGPDKKKKAGGKEISIDYVDQWHYFILTASFYFLDAMCVYRLLRLAKPKLPSYSLDAVLDLELGVRKLSFSQADHLSGLQKHQFMQQNYKIEYIVYGMFDTLSMAMLDRKILDLSFTVPTFSVTTDFWKFNSKPRCIADALHYYVLEKGYVLQSVGQEDDIGYEEVGIEEDDDTLDLKGWIMTLPAHLTAPGLCLVDEVSQLPTMIRAFVYDSDCTSAYPTCISILNVSKETTKREIITIVGIDEDVFRLQNINLLSGHVNMLEYGHEMFGLPTLFELEEMVVVDHQNGVHFKQPEQAVQIPYEEAE